MIDLSPILISLKTASASIIATFFLGLLAAHWVTSRKGEASRVFLDVVFTVPLVLPPTVAGFFLLLVFGANGPLGTAVLKIFGFKIAFSWFATVLAAVVMSFPLMYRSSLGAIEQVDRGLIDAARSLGMKNGQIFRLIILPNARGGIVSGAILAFARGLGEFGATSMIAGNIPGRTRTLPLAIYSKTAGGDMDSALIYVLIIMAICVAAVIALNYYHYKYERKRGERWY